MTKDEALKIAWDALSYINEGANNQGPHTGISWRCAANKSTEALNAIKAALEARDEPVAWVCDGEVRSLWWDKNQAIDRNAGHEFTPLYATPPQRKPLMEKEILLAWEPHMKDGLIEFARAIEAAHGIKVEA